MIAPILVAIAGMLLGSAYLVPGTLYSAALAWFAALLLTIVGNRKPLTPTLFFLFGFCVQAIVFYWLAGIIEYYAAFATTVSCLWACCYMCFAALQFFFCGLLYRQLKQSSLQRYRLALPVAWVTAEVLFPGLIPWMLGHTQIAIPQLAGTADIVGVPLVSFLMIWSCEAVSLLLGIAAHGERSRHSSRIVGAVGLGCIATFVVAYSAWRAQIINTELHTRPPLRVGVVQPNFTAETHFKTIDPALFLSTYRTLSFPLVTAAEPLDLLLWPESSVINDYTDETTSVIPGAPEDPFPGLNVPLLFGGQASVTKHRDAAKPGLHNSVYLLAPDGTFSGVYHKQRLFPFSESVPLSFWFPRLDSLIARSYSVVPGEVAKKGILFPGKDGQAAFSVAIAICYEDMWSDILQAQVHGSDASILAALSNDAWFLKSPAALQHHLLARWRAVELRRYLVRATVDGVSAVIDPFGQTRSEIPPFTSGTMITPDVTALATKSVFSYVGPLPLQLLAALFCVYALRPAHRVRINSEARVTEN